MFNYVFNMIVLQCNYNCIMVLIPFDYAPVKIVLWVNYDFNIILIRITYVCHMIIRFKYN